MSLAEYTSQREVQLGGLAIVAVVALGALVTMWYDIPLRRVFTTGFVEQSIMLAAPITLAAIGGLYAEKSGVFNIGLEGFMIIGAITTASLMYRLGGASPGQVDIWLAITITLVIAVLLTLLYGVLLIRYKADQIVAGLAVWFIGLGFGPFISRLVWGGVSSPGLSTINHYAAPVLAEIPVAGPIFFRQSPLVLLTLLLVVGSWLFLYRTRYGYWIQAAGENPEALDTAGVSVNRVRYAALIFSGVMACLGGAMLIAHEGSWIGTGDTVTSGYGWIAIVAYLFGNYNPIGAAAAALLFGALDMLQVQFQTVDVDVSGRIINLLPYIGVIIVLTIWGKTRMPAAVGEPYESED